MLDMYAHIVMKYRTCNKYHFLSFQTYSFLCYNILLIYCYFDNKSTILMVNL